MLKDRQRWEYEVVTIKVEKKAGTFFNPKLDLVWERSVDFNHYGSLGWELVAVVPMYTLEAFKDQVVNLLSEVRFIFKRPAI